MALEDLEKITEKIKKYNAKLLPVIKNRSNEEIKFLLDFGLKDFGENRIEDYKTHSKIYNKVSYHFIAPLQSRKIEFITDNFSHIYTLCRKKEVEIISKSHKKPKLLIQVNVDQDPNKNGVKVNELVSFYEYCIKKNLYPIGIMTIPSISSDVKKEFNKMNMLNQKLKKYFKFYNGELSMGMSNDYEVALDYGATIIRIGSKLFK